MINEKSLQIPIGLTRVEPRPYQTRIIDKAVNMFLGTYRNGAGQMEDAARSVMIESPTGSGKSCMGLLLAKALQVETGAKVGWVAMRRNLLQQVQAENQRHEINVDLQAISMFEKNPPSDLDLLVVDECVPGDTLVDVEDAGQRRQVRMDDVVLHGVGTKVLSYIASGGLEYQPITTRTPMGRKELLEVTVAVEGTESVLLITEEGKVWTDDGYKKPLDLMGNTVLCKSSRCQTYLYEQDTTRRQEEVRSNSAPDGTRGSALCLRLRPEGALVPSREEIQEVSLQPPSSQSLGHSDKVTGTDYSWDAAGRRVSQFRAQSADRSEDECSPENSPFDETAAGIREVETSGTGTAQRRTPDTREPRIWKRSRRVQHAIPLVHPGGRQPGLQAKEIRHFEIPRPVERTRIGSLVDGRRFDCVTRNARLHVFRKPINRAMASGALGLGSCDRDGQESAKTVPHFSAAERCETVAFGCSERDPSAVVQVRQIPADALVRGTVVAVQRTGRFVDTYDIGVANNHNFFADGILIHNCQHDAASSMAHLHNVIQPTWILGLTATPFRCDRVKLCFDKVVKDAGIHQLIQDGYLSTYDHYTIPKWESPQLADFYCRDPLRWGKSIFFFHTVSECFALQNLLNQRGFASEVVTGTSDRDAQLEAFRNGSVQILINCMVLTEGFNDPSLQTVWVRPSAKGLTIQMAGRVLRKCDGIEAKQIVQCQQTPHPFTKTAMYRQQYLWQSGEWRSLKANPLLNLCNENARRAIAQTEVRLPKYLKRKTGSRRRRRVVGF